MNLGDIWGAKEDSPETYSPQVLREFLDQIDTFLCSNEGMYLTDTEMQMALGVDRQELDDLVCGTVLSKWKDDRIVEVYKLFLALKDEVKNELNRKAKSEKAPIPF